MKLRISLLAICILFFNSCSLAIIKYTSKSLEYLSLIKDGNYLPIQGVYFNCLNYEESRNNLLPLDSMRDWINLYGIPKKPFFTKKVDNILLLGFKIESSDKNISQNNPNRNLWFTYDLRNENNQLIGFSNGEKPQICPIRTLSQKFNINIDSLYSIDFNLLKGKSKKHLIEDYSDKQIHASTAFDHILADSQLYSDVKYLLNYLDTTPIIKFKPGPIDYNFKGSPEFASILLSFNRNAEFNRLLLWVCTISRSNTKQKINNYIIVMYDHNEQYYLPKNEEVTIVIERILIKIYEIKNQMRIDEDNE